jgi:organic radical activating enzyme
MGSKTCLYPFNSLSISPRGVLRPCCYYRHDDFHSWENIKDLDSNVSWPTKNIKKLQEDMLGPEIEKNTPSCDVCWKPEKLELESHRLRYHKFIKHPFEKLIENPELRFLDIQFGYLCNISCIMCHTEESSKFQSTMIKLVNITKTPEQKKLYQSNFKLYENLDWTYDDHAYQKLLNLCYSVKRIKISGGEPFFNPKFKPFLEFLLTKKEKVEFLHVTTNLTIYDKEIVDLLNRFPKVRFRFSLESTGKEDEFLRWPTNWEEKLQNLHAYLNQLTTADFVSSTTIQSLNLFSCLNTFEFLKSLKKNVVIQYQPAIDTLAGIYYSDHNYIQHYLSIFEKNKISQYLEEHLDHKNNPTAQVNYFLDMANIQNKNLADEFPIWYKYHDKYI